MSTAAGPGHETRPSRFEAPMSDRVTSLRNRPVDVLPLALSALQRGYPLGRPMTPLERLALAVASTQPTHRLDITSPSGLTQTDVAKAFRLLVPRIEREKGRGKGPLIYVGSIAKGLGRGGFHMHLVLWEYPYTPVWKGHTRDVGMGLIRAKAIMPAHGQSLLASVSYALAQHEPIFGSNTHEHHEPRQSFKRAFVSPQAETLKSHHPELFRVTHLAKDQSVSDERLFSELPMFIQELRPELKTRRSTRLSAHALRTASKHERKEEKMSTVVNPNTEVAWTNAMASEDQQAVAPGQVVVYSPVVASCDYDGWEERVAHSRAYVDWVLEVEFAEKSALADLFAEYRLLQTHEKKKNDEGTADQFWSILGTRNQGLVAYVVEGLTDEAEYEAASTMDDFDVRLVRAHEVGSLKVMPR